MTINCCVIDDEPLALELLVSYVKKTSFLNLVGQFSNAIEATDHISSEKVDLLFLDIQMPEINGIEFSRMVKKSCKIIFTTAFSNYALDGYKVNTLDYLLKPISYSDFLQSAQRALEWYEHLQSPAAPEVGPEYIFVKSEYKLVQIELKRILYIEGLKDYIKFYLEGESFPILSLMSMKSLEDLLPEKEFVRVHRSYIVRGDKIKIIERNRIVFGKVYIPISDSYKEAFQLFINKIAIFSV